MFFSPPPLSLEIKTNGGIDGGDRWRSLEIKSTTHLSLILLLFFSLLLLVPETVLKIEKKNGN